ncbi:unnamed protein product [Fusarium graminearum]|uniref:Chromosome 4, complete genome n=1 Tax=Gibberella zeae (strain ATCC MYA-4620 / CBS 123657 / FGSC 9075 / NRRL 31084 / PH-1) TaxID=229533 RepID=I1S818_GIBZE|nr:hypothetical protein FGSG_12993 [Fusarium graminearum PH-1]ESU12959.1 hypothetical protein FGSG_12993 [Fusarium graminearum PH-1]CEF83478.1 unnamed protein product [Fusarium graminearum]CZS72539.1 unnamed protein product [Fusarium graminearum]|eukprot:XP_011326466.1 hypothetical protein FGSG_12993 [Fusarium graminearum PH-1]
MYICEWMHQADWIPCEREWCSGKDEGFSMPTVVQVSISRLSSITIEKELSMTYRGPCFDLAVISPTIFAVRMGNVKTLLWSKPAGEIKDPPYIPHLLAEGYLSPRTQYIQKDSVLTIELTLMRDVEIQFVETNPKQ